jgi:hypothetical protein
MRSTQCHFPLLATKCVKSLGLGDGACWGNNFYGGVYLRDNKLGFSACLTEITWIARRQKNLHSLGTHQKSRVRVFRVKWLTTTSHTATKAI